MKKIFMNKFVIQHSPQQFIIWGWLCLMATSRQPAHFEISHLFLSALSVMRNKEKL